MIAFNFGLKTDAEVKLVLHAYTFVWLQTGDRVWKLAAMSPRCSPSELLEFMKREDPTGYRALLEGIGIREDEIPCADSALIGV